MNTLGNNPRRKFCLGPSVRRALAPTALTTLGGSALAIAINVATAEPAAIWPWFAVAALTALVFLGALWQQRRTQPITERAPEPDTGGRATRSDSGGEPTITTGPSITRSLVWGPVYQVSNSGRFTIPGPTAPGPHRRLIQVIAVLAAAAILVAITVVGANLPTVRGLIAATPDPPTGMSTARAVPADVTVHEVWASSRANKRITVPADQWIATDFVVTQPYLRSVEVAAVSGPTGSGDPVLLRVLDENGTEIAAGEAAIIDYRAKYVFTHPVDVTAHLGKRLYLQLVNDTDQPVGAYMTTDDRDPAVGSYIACPNATLAGCPNPRAQDLSALIIGRTAASPW